MHAKLSLTLFVAVLLALSGVSEDRSAGQGWSEVKIRVLDDATGKPVPGARLRHLCTISPYYNQAFVADSNGVANVMIFRTWVMLSASDGQSLINQVLIGGTNEVAQFCTNAVIRLKPATHDATR